MKITRIQLYQVALPFDAGPYKLSGGRSWEAMDSSIVRIDTDSGIVGWGESCPFGANYLEAFAEGARAGIEELAAALLGQNPAEPAVIYDRMNFNLLGHGYAKHAIDMACWDILGKLTKQPLYMLFGGILSEYPPVAGGIPPHHDERMDDALRQHRAQKCRQFSAKASGDPEADIEYLRLLGEKLRPGESVKFDANGGWRVDQALRVMRATESIDIYFEEPCGSYEANRNLRKSVARPIVLDECALDTDILLRAWQDGVCDAVNLKIGRVGGLTPALTMRDFCVSLGIPFYVQCTGGSNITQSAIVHLAHSVAAEQLLYIWDIGDLASIKIVSDPIPLSKGRMHAHDLPGLGVNPIEFLLGEPVADYALG